MLNFWAPRADAHASDFQQDWSAGRDDSTMPWQAVYDFVEAYDYNSATGGFELAWRDDFDGTSLDTTKWSAANNVGWDQNLSTFMSSQVSVHDGNLYLTMEKAEQHAIIMPAFVDFEYNFLQ